MARMFQQKGKKERGRGSALLSVLLSLLLLSLLVYGIGSMGSSTKRESLRTVEQAVRRAAVQCYALEGRYPSNIEYLEEHYGLILYWEKYFYHYQVDASNMAPTISVTLIEDARD